MSKESERSQRIRDANDISMGLAGERARKEYADDLRSYDVHDFSLPDQRENNANLAKIIWQLKLRTTLLHNVLNQIIYKWPEDKMDFLEIIEKNRVRFENDAPQNVLDLVEKKDIYYSEVTGNSAFNIADVPFPSRVQHAKRGLR